MKQEPCIECGAPVVSKRHTETLRVGRYTVEDGSCLRPVCENGHAVISLKDLAEYERAIRCPSWPGNLISKRG